MKARFFAIAALVLGLASCQKDFAPEANLGAEVDYRLEVSAPELGTTRAGVDGADTNNAKDSAFGAIDYFQGADWSKVDLRYTLEIYDADENGELKGGVATLVKDRQAIVVDEYKAVTFETRLAPKRNYRFVVFADFVENGAATAWSEAEKLTKDGLRHSFEKSLTNITLIKEDINDEASDAYFAVKHVVPSNNTHNTDAITLTRPYGKLRVVATDLHELNLNVKPGSVKVVYGAYNAKAFNAVTGEIAEEYAEKEFDYNYVDEGIVYTEGYDALKGEKDRNTHMTIFTDYILATDTQHTINFNMLVNDEDGVEIKATAFSTEIPVQRNHLTTIIGNVLTTATEVEVTINDNFFGELTKELKIAYNAKTLQQYIDEANPGDTIYVGEGCNCEGIFLINKDINIEGWGANATITGKVGIIAGSDNTNFKNIKFVVNDQTEKGAPNGQTNKNGIVVIYASAVGFENCVFEGMTEAVYAIYNKDNNAQERVTVKNCEFYGNRAIRTRANVVVDGCTFEGNTKPAVDVLGFGATDAEGYVQFTNNYSTANVAGVMLKVGNHEFRHVVFNVGGNAEAAINSIWRDESYTHANLANFSREFTNEVKIINYHEVEPESVSAAAHLQMLLDNDELGEANITVLEDISYVGKGFEVNRDAVIDFQNNVLNAGSTPSSYWYALQVYGKNLEIYNANFTRAGISADNGANVVFHNGTIKHNPERTSRYIFYAKNGSTITIKDGKFVNDRAKNSFFWADSNAHIIVEGGTFNGAASNKKVVESAGGEVIIYGGTFNFDPTKWVVSTSVVEKVGSNWVVTPITPSTNISDAITNVENGGKVVLADGNYTMPAINNKAVTIVGSRDVVLTVNKPNMTGADVTLEGITVKGSGYATGVQHVNTVTYNNVKVEGEMCLYGEAVTFNNCEFELANGQYIWTYGCKNSTFNNCVFNTVGKAILVYNEGAGATNVTVKGCTFNASAGAKAGAIKNQNCAAIEIDNFQNSGVGVAHNVTASENTVGANFSGEWRIKNFLAGDAINVNGTAYTQIAIDGQLMTIDADKNVTVL